MARFGDLDLSAVDRVEFMRVLVIYQNDPSHTDPALQWVMFGSPGGTVVKLDETECNRILNGKNPDMFGFAANLSASQLSCRARTHFLRLLDSVYNSSLPGWFYTWRPERKLAMVIVFAHLLTSRDGGP